MKGDFTRDTYNYSKHYLRVLSQQGRVMLDADWNEQVSILLHAIETLAGDLIGPYGGPKALTSFMAVSQKELGQLRDLQGNLLSAAQKTALGKRLPKSGFLIGVGHYYVDGLLVENDDFGAYTDQTGFPFPDTTPWGQLQDKASPFLAYLDVWERHIVYLEDQVPYNPGIREVALGGPDTTSRSQVTWQVKAQVIPSNQVSTDAAQQRARLERRLRDRTKQVADLNLKMEEAAKAGADTATMKAQMDKLNADIAETRKQIDAAAGAAPAFGPADATQMLGALHPLSTGTLRAQARTDKKTEEACNIDPEAQYRGLENQLYRVEIHTGTGGVDAKGNNIPATFKWSRENGSVIFPILEVEDSDSTTKTTLVSLANLGRDDKLSLSEGDWAEIVDDSYTLQGQAGTLLKVLSVDRAGKQVTLDGLYTSNTGKDPNQHPYLRRWDYSGKIQSDGALQIVETTNNTDNWLDLEDGVQVQFSQPDSGDPSFYRTGDYWLIPARVATGDVEWPHAQDAAGAWQPLFRPANGILHHYAPLAIFDFDASDNLEVAANGDLRHLF